MIMELPVYRLVPTDSHQIPAPIFSLSPTSTYFDLLLYLLYNKMLYDSVQNVVRFCTTKCCTTYTHTHKSQRIGSLRQI